MSLLAFLTSAVGGSILGGVTQILGSVVGEVKEWSASKRRIAELVALKEKEIAIGEMNAFTAAQAGAMPSSYSPPENAPMGMHWMMTLAEFCVRMVRPSMVAGACIYIWTRPSEVLGGLQGEILTASFACMYFWLGTRHQNSNTKR
jgi:hypothetical protein